MSDVAIRVEGLSKQYRIGGPQASYKTLRESLVGAARSPIRRAERLLRGEAATDHRETIWALKDVSFEVKHGEVLGIIGRNGAGKSTLLKILSRITAPTEGTVDLYGRVGSLLEVGTGFHPELTGRENIYLNGAILGMKRAEIDGKFDEIVAFAELEKFLDTPVKHYSSGMYVRLAFAVAAHLDPEILLVDEVLAVGDAAFQKKCLGKMGEVAGEGRTVLFVSHNMGSIHSLCPQSLLLKDGHVSLKARTDEVIKRYLGEARDSFLRKETIWDTPRIDSQHGRSLRFEDCRVFGTNGIETHNLKMGEPFAILIKAVALQELGRVSFVVGIDSDDERRITTAASEEVGNLYSFQKGDSIELVARFENLILNVGQYFISLSARTFGCGLDLVRPAIGFEVSGTRHLRAQHMVDLWGDVRFTPVWESRGDGALSH